MADDEQDDASGMSMDVDSVLKQKLMAEIDDDDLIKLMAMKNMGDGDNDSMKQALLLMMQNQD